MRFVSMLVLFPLEFKVKFNALFAMSAYDLMWTCVLRKFQRLLLYRSGGNGRQRLGLVFYGDVYVG